MGKVGLGGKSKMGSNLRDRMVSRQSSILWPSFRMLFLIAASFFFVVATSSCSTSATTDCSVDTFVVTTRDDIIDGACNDHCSLREAIEAANTCETFDLYRIQLPAGTYQLTLRGPGDNRGDLEIKRHTSILGVGNGSLIEGPSTWNHRIFSVEEDASLHLEALQITGGDIEDIGGGILNRGVLTMTDVLSHNHKGITGGALFNSGNATLSNVNFVGNRVPFVPWLELDDFAGFPELGADFGVQCGGAVANSGMMVIRDSIFEVNQAAKGGGLCNAAGASLTIDRSRILNNEGRGGELPAGGGIWNQGDLRLLTSEVSGHRGYERWVGGAGIYHGQGTLIIHQALIQNNGYQFRAQGEGGGLFIQGDFTIDDGLFLDNGGERGGGIFIKSGNGSISHTTIARNRAVLGAGLFIGERTLDEPSVELTNVTISSNVAVEAGGAAFIAEETSSRGVPLAHFSHVTVARNTDPSSGSYGGIKVNGGRVRIANSLLTWNGPGSCIAVGTGSSRIEFLGENRCFEDGSAIVLPDLSEDNGQWVHVLLASSPAIDQVPAGDCPADDQRGMIRPQGEACDLGAYEFAPMVLSDELPITLATATPTPQMTVIPEIPTINTDALCWKGPGPLYEVISSVKAGTEVTLLGRGEVGSWWIIDNPRFPGVACWLPGDDLDVELELLPAELLIFVAPPIPTPTATPILGCLYQGQNDPQAICYPIDQCPVPFDQSQGACAP